MHRTVLAFVLGVGVVGGATRAYCETNPVRAFYAIASARNSTTDECRAYGGSVIPHDKYAKSRVVAQGFTTGNHTVSGLPLACIAFGENVGGFWVMEKIALHLCCWPLDG